MDTTRRRLIAGSSSLLGGALLASCAGAGTERGHDAARATGGMSLHRTGDEPPRRIVVCCDGTTATVADGTNIGWIAASCEGPGARPVPQHVCHFPGVGSRRSERLRGGAFGYGLSRQVLDAYGFVRDTWRGEADEVFIFGFSRGAFAARSLANFIGLVGCRVPEDLTLRAYAAYWRRNWRAADAPTPAVDRAAAHAVESTVGDVTPGKVAFLGVFDTVGSLGASAIIRRESSAAAALRRLHDERSFERLHDVELRGHVSRACHAVALDEDLGAFAPVLWADTPGDQSRQQVWFAGGHGDVGGGHEGPEDNRALAKVPLLWMMQRAYDAGLALKQGAMDDLRAQANPLAPQHDAPPRIEPWLARALRQAGGSPPRAVPPDAAVHKAVRERLGKPVETRGIDGKPAPRTPYHPPGLPRSVRVVSF